MSSAAFDMIDTKACGIISAFASRAYVRSYSWAARVAEILDSDALFHCCAARDMVFDFVKNMHGSKVALTDTVWRQLAKTLDSVIAARMETAVITAAEAQDPSLRRGISQKEFVEVIKTNKRFLQFALSIQTHVCRSLRPGPRC